MSEETNNEGGLSGLKKTILGTLGTVITAGGVWLTTQLGGGHSEDKEEPKTEVAAPVQAQPAAPVIINLQNNNTNQQKQQSNNSNSNNVKQQPTTQPAVQPVKKEEESW
jgi:flagellar basal body-associated protein FliL